MACLGRGKEMANFAWGPISSGGICMIYFPSKGIALHFGFFFIIKIIKKEDRA